MAKPMSVERKAALILAGFAVTEGAIVVLGFLGAPAKFMAYIGFAAGRHGAPLGWLLALVVTAAFTAFSLRLPSVRENLFRPSWLKLLALPMALFAGILEESVFRSTLMNYIEHQGAGVAVQVLVSGLAFGLAHGVWGLFGKSLRATLGATLVTGVLGTALAVIYLAAGPAAHALHRCAFPDRCADRAGSRTGCLPWRDGQPAAGTKLNQGGVTGEVTTQYTIAWHVAQRIASGWATSYRSPENLTHFIRQCCDRIEAQHGHYQKP